MKKFVTKMGDKMDYVVAIDKERQTSDGYMKEFGINVFRMPSSWIRKGAWSGKVIRWPDWTRRLRR